MVDVARAAASCLSAEAPKTPKRSSKSSKFGVVQDWLVVWLPCFVFPYILGIIPVDELIFFRGVAKNHQPEEHSGVQKKRARAQGGTVLKRSGSSIGTKTLRLNHENRISAAKWQPMATKVLSAPAAERLVVEKRARSNWRSQRPDKPAKMDDFVGSNLQKYHGM